MTQASIALNRFGIGARPDEVVGNGRDWLSAQMSAFAIRPPAIAAAPDSARVATDLASY